MDFIDPASRTPSSGSANSSISLKRFCNGVLLIDKPEGVTSHDVVHKTKKILGVKKVGHCGTLDPFATGILLLCMGQATRIADQLLTQDKTYLFTAHMGVETDTLDRTGKVIASQSRCNVTRERIETALQDFLGESIQEVPLYSAVKVGGKRLYHLARKGVEVELPSRPIRIDRLQLLQYQWPEMKIEVACSKGTYVRQLASDLGRKLGCGAHVKELRRLASGSFTVDHAIGLERLDNLHRADRLHEAMISMSEALGHLPLFVIEAPQLQDQLMNGHLSSEWIESHRQCFKEKQKPVRLLSTQGSLLALYWPHSTEKGNRKLRIFYQE